MALKHKIRDALPSSVYPYALRAYRTYRFSKLRLLAALRLQQRRFGRTPDLVHPLYFNEKVLWRMLYDRRPLLELCCDRVAVRDYVASRAGARYLIPILGVFDRPEDIPWTELDPPYVVKATHGCDWNIFVRRPADLDPPEFTRTLKKWLRTNYYQAHGEWPYKHVPRRVIVERFVGLDGKVPADFKFYCFAGEPATAAICCDRFENPEAAWTWRDPAWNLLTVAELPPAPGSPTEPPSRWSEMLEVVRLLCRDFDHVRVDLYCAEDRVYFSELTPIIAAGGWRFSEGFEAWLGRLWELPPKKAVRRQWRHRWQPSTS